jgi:hypothetical protein
VTVWERPHDSFSGKVCAGTGLIFNYELLSEPLGQSGTQEACQNVGNTAGWEATNQTHRSCRIGVRPCNPRYSGQCDSARQVQQFSTRKFHGDGRLT